MKVIDNVSSKFHLTEVGHGNQEMKFALFDKVKQEVITPFCKCKDYFNDAFWTFKTGRATIAQYGFSFKKEEGEGILDKPRLSVAIRINPKTDSLSFEKLNKENLTNILSLLYKFEKSNGFTKSRGIVSEDENFFIITFDRKWIEVPYLSSGLFLLLRMGYHYDRKSQLKSFYEGHPEHFLSPNDAMYFKNVWDVLQDLEDGYIDTTQSYSNFSTSSEAHNSSGIQAYKTAPAGKKYTPKSKEE